MRLCRAGHRRQYDTIPHEVMVRALSLLDGRNIDGASSRSITTSVVLGLLLGLAKGRFVLSKAATAVVSHLYRDSRFLGLGLSLLQGFE